jgi:hypothetical protein
VIHIIDGQYSIGMFATRDIKYGEELSFGPNLPSLPLKKSSLFKKNSLTQFIFYLPKFTPKPPKPESLSFDYKSVTESEKEFESSI